MNTQPEWLRQQTAGLEGGYKWTVLLEGTTFAVVREPGSTYWSGRGSREYGATAFYFVDKRIRNSSAILSGITLRRGGRPTAAEKRKWRRMITLSDETKKAVLPKKDSGWMDYVNQSLGRAYGDKK